MRFLHKKETQQKDIGNQEPNSEEDGKCPFGCGQIEDELHYLRCPEKSMVEYREKQGSN